PAVSAPTRRLIVNADDLGYDPAVNEGIVLAMRSGVVTSSTLMVNLPHSAHGAELARGLPVGLHLNLSRGSPLSRRFPPSLLRDGAFEETLASSLPAGVVADEAVAQLARAEELLGARPTHVDVHRHLHRVQGIREGLSRLAAARGLPVRALDEGMRAALRRSGVKTTDHFVGEASGEAYWTEQRFAETVAALQEGLTELMCHPGYPPRETRTSYALQRAVELATLTSVAARTALTEAGVALVSFAALAGR
ncbi:MAG TPA: ChbG/HpnK family deacetylase, partial [Myxococcaceae bacterium]|nr:ChbG/HpnK family deacetylase [Myxococcaceae bacterium]